MRITTAIILLILIEISFVASGQTIKTIIYQSKLNGLCSRTLFLDNDNYFFYESGCEGRSRVTFGEYRLDDSGRILFNIRSLDTLAPIRSIVSGRANKKNDSIAVIRIYDRYNQPLCLTRGLFALDEHNNFTEVQTNKQGELKLDRTKYKTVLLDRMLNVYNEAISFSITDNYIEVFLSLPGLLFEYSEITAEKEIKLDLKVVQDGLYDLTSRELLLKKE